jgi:hypothetical protein
MDNVHKVYFNAPLPSQVFRFNLPNSQFCKVLLATSDPPTKHTGGCSLSNLVQMAWWRVGNAEWSRCQMMSIFLTSACMHTLLSYVFWNVSHITAGSLKFVHFMQMATKCRKSQSVHKGYKDKNLKIISYNYVTDIRMITWQIIIHSGYLPSIMHQNTLYIV